MTPRIRDHRSAAGFTIIELVVAATVLLALSLFVTQLILSGQRAQRYSNRLGRVTALSQSVLDDIKRDLRSALRVFGNDALGMEYRSRLEPWLGFAPIPSTRLPVIQPMGSFAKDQAGEEKTGNELLFARHAWSDVFECASGKIYRVDIHRIEHLFLRFEGSNLDGRPVINLCKWMSEPLASAAQIEAIRDDNDRAEVLRHLLTSTPDVAGREHESVEVVWMFGDDPATVGTFRQIMSDGLLADKPQGSRADPWQIEQAENLSDPGFFFSNLHAVAANDSPLVFGVSRFAIRDDAAGSGAGFPHGLEFQVIGPPAARQVLVHLTSSSTNNDGLKAHFDLQVVIYVREG